MFSSDWVDYETGAEVKHNVLSDGGAFTASQLAVLQNNPGLLKRAEKIGNDLQALLAEIDEAEIKAIGNSGGAAEWEAY